MTKIIEITDTHVIVDEKGVHHHIPIETFKFAPRVNDFVSLIRDEKGIVVNVFLEEKPQIQVIHINEPFIEEKPIKDPYKASKFVGIYSIVYSLLMLVSVPSLFNDLDLADFGLEGLTIEPIQIYIMIGLFVFMLINGILLLVLKSRLAKIITIIPLFFFYTLLMLSAVVILVASPIIGLFPLIIFGLPFAYSIKFFKDISAQK